MVARRRRPEMPYDNGPVLDALGAARDTMIRVLAQVRPQGSASRAATAVVAAIDGFAGLLTGDPTYFHAKPHGGGVGRSDQARPAE